MVLGAVCRHLAAVRTDPFVAYALGTVGYAYSVSQRTFSPVTRDFGFALEASQWPVDRIVAAPSSSEVLTGTVGDNA